jgi:hypothetical protein
MWLDGGASLCPLSSGLSGFDSRPTFRYRGGVQPKDRPSAEARPMADAPASTGTTLESATSASSSGRNSQLRLILVVGTLIGLFICLGFVDAGYVLYDRATKIDRSTPGSVLYQYLQARFEDREPARLKLFVCKSPRLNALDALFDDLVAREKTFNVEFHVDMATTRTEVNSSTATVLGNLVLWYREEGTFYEDPQPWRFSFVYQDGWRLCGADRQ